MRAALYARVSTQHKGQETANQLLQLRECCQAQHWSVLQEYEDHESGGKSERTAFQQMLRDAAARSFDVLFFWSLDRLTREEPWPLSNTWNCWKVTAFVGVASRNRGLIAPALSAMSSSACWLV
jgi:DNA invertase Pin-like site-specific DNA recombinase